MSVAARFRTGIWCSLTMLVLAAVPSPARAQSPKAPPPDPVLESLITRALELNPALQAIQAGIDAARERPAQARALPDPMLSVWYTNEGWAPSLGRMTDTTLALMASQSLPWPGKRQLRADIASRDAGLAEQQLARARLTIVAAVKRAYIGLLLASELHDLAEDQRNLWEDIEVVVRSRYAVGQGAQQDVLRVQLENTRVERLAIEQATEAQVRIAELGRLVGTTEGLVLPESSVRLVMQRVAWSLAESIDRSRALSPELAAARVAIDRDRLSVSLAQKNLKPDFTVQAGFMNRGGLDPMWLAGVGITLPANRKSRAGAIAEANLTLKSEQRSLESLDLQLRYLTEERYRRIESAERTITLFDKGILLQDRMSLEAAVANYQTGSVPFAAVLEAMTTLAGDQWTRTTLVAEHESLKASLEEAGMEPTAGMGALSGPGRAAGAGRAGSATSGGMGGGL